jgi:hypothetical protein
MELRKVLEIFSYKGDMWYINPYIENGKIVRNTTYKVKSNRQTGWGSYTFDSSWGKGKYYQGNYHEKVTDKDEINTNIRVFTTIKEAKDALAEFEKQYAYKINDSADKEIARLEREKAEIDKKIEELKKTKERAFKNISTSFIKKS